MRKIIVFLFLIVGIFIFSKAVYATPSFGGLPNEIGMFAPPAPPLPFPTPSIPAPPESLPHNPPGPLPPIPEQQAPNVPPPQREPFPNLPAGNPPQSPLGPEYPAEPPPPSLLVPELPAGEYPQSPLAPELPAGNPPQSPLIPDTEPEEELLPNDVIGHWAFEYLRDAINYGFYYIDESGLARPNQYLNRGELAYMLNRFLYVNRERLQNIGFTPGEPNVVHGVENSLFASHINSLAALGILGGDASYEPQAPVQRQELARIWLNVFLMTPIVATYETQTELALLIYSDASEIAPWAREAVAFMSERGLMGMGSERFEPISPLTRAQAAAIFVRVQRFLINN